MNWRARYCRNLEIVEAYQKGDSLRNLGKQWRLSPVAIGEILKTDGIKMRPSGNLNPVRGPRNPERALSVLKAHDAGQTYAGIAKKLGVSRQRIHIIYKRAAQAGIGT